MNKHIMPMILLCLFGMNQNSFASFQDQVKAETEILQKRMEETRQEQQKKKIEIFNSFI